MPDTSFNRRYGGRAGVKPGDDSWLQNAFDGSALQGIGQTLTGTRKRAKIKGTDSRSGMRRALDFALDTLLPNHVPTYRGDIALPDSEDRISAMMDLRRTRGETVRSEIEAELAKTVAIDNLNMARRGELEYGGPGMSSVADDMTTAEYEEIISSPDSDPAAIGEALVYLQDRRARESFVEMEALANAGRLAAPLDALEYAAAEHMKGKSIEQIAEELKVGQFVQPGDEMNRLLYAINQQLDLYRQSGQFDKTRTLTVARNALIRTGQLGLDDDSIEPGDAYFDQIMRQYGEDVTPMQAFSVGAANTMFSTIKGIARLADAEWVEPKDRDMLHRMASAAAEERPWLTGAGSLAGGITDPVFVALGAGLVRVPALAAQKGKYATRVAQRGVSDDVAKALAANATQRQVMIEATSQHFTRYLSPRASHAMGELVVNATEGAVANAAAGFIEGLGDDLQPWELAVYTAENAAWGAALGFGLEGLIRGTGGLSRQARRLVFGPDGGILTDAEVRNAFDNALHYVKNRGEGSDEITAEIQRGLVAIKRATDMNARRPLSRDQIDAVLRDAGVDIQRLAGLRVKVDNTVRGSADEAAPQGETGLLEPGDSPPMSPEQAAEAEEAIRAAQQRQSVDKETNTDEPAPVGNVPGEATTTDTEATTESPAPIAPQAGDTVTIQGVEDPVVIESVSEDGKFVYPEGNDEGIPIETVQIVAGEGETVLPPTLRRPISKIVETGKVAGGQLGEWRIEELPNGEYFAQHFDQTGNVVASHHNPDIERVKNDLQIGIEEQVQALNAQRRVSEARSTDDLVQQAATYRRQADRARATGNEKSARQADQFSRAYNRGAIARLSEFPDAISEGTFRVRAQARADELTGQDYARQGTEEDALRLQDDLYAETLVAEQQNRPDAAQLRRIAEATRAAVAERLGIDELTVIDRRRQLDQDEAEAVAEAPRERSSGRTLEEYRAQIPGRYNEQLAQIIDGHGVVPRYGAPGYHVIDSISGRVFPYAATPDAAVEAAKIATNKLSETAIFPPNVQRYSPAAGQRTDPVDIAVPRAEALFDRGLIENAMERLGRVAAVDMGRVRASFEIPDFPKDARTKGAKLAHIEREMLKRLTQDEPDATPAARPVDEPGSPDTVSGSPEVPASTRGDAGDGGAEPVREGDGEGLTVEKLKQRVADEKARRAAMPVRHVEALDAYRRAVKNKMSTKKDHQRVFINAMADLRKVLGRRAMNHLEPHERVSYEAAWSQHHGYVRVETDIDDQGAEFWVYGDEKRRLTPDKLREELAKADKKSEAEARERARRRAGKPKRKSSPKGPPKYPAKAKTPAQQVRALQEFAEKSTDNPEARIFMVDRDGAQALATTPTEIRIIRGATGDFGKDRVNVRDDATKTRLQDATDTILERAGTGQTLQANPADLHDVIQRALPIAKASENNLVMLHRNPDDTLGVSAHVQDVGSAEINVQRDAIPLAAVDGRRLLESLKFHGQTGSKSIGLSIGKHTATPGVLRVESDNATSVIVQLQQKKRSKVQEEESTVPHETREPEPVNSLESIIQHADEAQGVQPDQQPDTGVDWVTQDAESKPGRRLLHKFKAAKSDPYSTVNVGVRSIGKMLNDALNLLQFETTEQLRSSAGGHYVPDVHITRVRSSTMSGTVFHEGGHALSAIIRANDPDFIKRNRGVLLDYAALPGSRASKQSPEEGFAEWMRQYIATPSKVAEDAFTQTTVSMLERKHPKAIAAMRDAARAYSMHMSRPLPVRWLSVMKDVDKGVPIGKSLGSRILTDYVSRGFAGRLATRETIRKIGEMGDSFFERQRLMREAMDKLKDTPADIERTYQSLNHIEQMIGMALEGPGKVPEGAPTGLRVHVTGDLDFDAPLTVHYMDDEGAIEAIKDEFGEVPTLRETFAQIGIKAPSGTYKHGETVVLAEKSVADAIEPISRDEWPEFEAYAQIKATVARIETRAREGERFPYQTMDEPGSDYFALVRHVKEAEKKNPTYVSVFKDLEEISNATLILGWMNGELTLDQVQAFRHRWDHYIPLTRQGERGASTARAGATTQPTMNIRQSRGSYKAAEPILMAMHRRLTSAVNAHYWNRFALAPIEFAERVSEMDVSHEAKAAANRMAVPLRLDTKKAATATPDELRKVVFDYIVQEVQAGNTMFNLDPEELGSLTPEDISIMDGLDIWRRVPPKAIRVVAPVQNGVRTYYSLIDENLYRVFAADERAGDIARLAQAGFGEITNSLKRQITNTFAFAFRSLARDPLTAMQFGEDPQAIIPYWYHVVGALSIATGRTPNALVKPELMSRVFREITAEDFVARKTKLQNELTEGIIPQGFHDMTLVERSASAPGMVYRTLVKPVEVWQALTGQRAVANFMESAPRVGAYVMAKRRGLSDEAAQYAADTITGNFSEKPLSPNAHAIYRAAGFLNPAFQIFGQYTQRVTAPDRASQLGTLGFRLGSVASFTALSWAVYEMFKTDEDREADANRTERERLTHMNIKGMRIPFDYGFTGATQSFVWNTLDETFGDLPPVEKRKLASKMLIETLPHTSANPLEFFPMAAQGFTESFLMGDRGFSVYRGQPLVPDYMRHFEPSEQYFDSTPDVYKWIGRATGQSPIKIDNFMRNSVGVQVDQFAKLVDFVDQGMTVDEAADLPFIGSMFTRDPIGWNSQPIRKADELSARFGQIEDRLEKMGNDPNIDREAYQALLDQAERIRPARQAMNDVSRLWRDIKALRADTENNHRDKIRELERQMTMVARETLNQITETNRILQEQADGIDGH